MAQASGSRPCEDLRCAPPKGGLRACDELGPDEEAWDDRETRHAEKN
jgi:hypothetical protein